MDMMNTNMSQSQQINNNHLLQQLILLNASRDLSLSGD